MFSYLVCFWFLLFLCRASSVERGFILTAPKRLLAGSSENICLSLYNVTSHANISLSLLHADTDDKIASTSHVMPEGGNTCLELVIPPTLQTRGRLHLKVNFKDIPEYIVNSVKEIHIQQDPLLIFVETDKPVYKPGQMVLLRVMVLRADLTPVLEPIRRIWLESPSEVRLAQWSNVSTEFGLVQLQFQLSSEPLQGVWKIKVDQGQQHQTTHVSIFEVREYVLPRFQVTITPPDYILADAEYLQWKICAKYSYGQPVNGELHVKAIPQVPTWRQRKAKPIEIHYIAQLNNTDGCEMFNVTGAELGLSDWDVAPNNVAVTATVTEDGTGTSQNSSTTSSVLHQALKLQFLHYSSQYFKPSLPYRGKVRVSLQNDVPASNELIQLCLKVQGKGEWSRTLVACQNFTSEEDGFVHFIVPPQHKNIVLLSLAATAVEYNTKYYSPDKRWRVFMDQPTAFFDVQSWYSPSESYIMVNEEKDAPRCHHYHSFNVYYITETNISSRTFYYLVKSRGDLIHFGQVNHTQGEAVRYYEDWFNVLGGNDDNPIGDNVTEECDEEKSVNKLSLKIFIKPIMSPSSYLMVYYIRDDGEIVAATHTLNIAKCFANKVSAKFLEEESLPGSQVTFKISASVNSLCTVSAVDESTTYLASSNLIDTEKVLRSLTRLNIDANSSPRQKDEWEYCAKLARNSREDSPTTSLPEVDEAFWPLKRKRSIMTGPVSRYVDAIQAFDDFGVVVMTDLTLETRPCAFPNRVGNRSPIARVGRQRARGRARGGISQEHMMFARSGVAPLAYPLATSERREYTEEVLQSAVEIRTYFPETWLWDLVYVEKEMKMSKELPHTVTTWIGSVACISPHRGLGIAPITSVRAFQPFFLDYTVPYAIKRGEVVTLKVSLFNYLNDDAPVRIILEDSPGIEVLSEQWFLETCVETRTQLVHEFRVRAYELGEVNVTVSGEIDPDINSSNMTCGTYVKRNTRDRIIKPLLVKAEGFSMEETFSSFICLSDSSNETSVQWNLTLPDDVVKDSARAEVSAVADLLGPTLQNLDNLVTLPMGCGEQNMILFVPNIHVIKYLKASKQENPVLTSQAVKNMNRGYQRELNYQHSDGSYSAFGSADSSGSMWLTAFVVKSFAQAREYIFIDEDDLKKSIKWITKKQLENGCFPVVGQVFHKDMKGGLTGETSSAALTAYVLISLLETKLPLPPSVASNVVYCLRGDEEPDVYTLALSTYALTLLGKKELAEESLRHLLKSANKERDLMWWEKPVSDSLALNIEITAYSVLSLVTQGGEENLINALRAIRWISKHRNPNGGFVSTQDTIVALEALTKYALAAPIADTSLTVLAIANDVEEAFRIKDSNRLLLQRASLPVVPTLVEIAAEGEGCVLVQANVKYNVKTATGSDAFELEVETGPVASVDECTLQRVEACVRYKIEGETSNMAVLEVAMVTGYSPDKTSLHKLSQNSDLDLKRWEEDKDQVNFYFEQLSTRRQCVSFIVVQEVEVENPAPAIVKLYDYYHRELSITAEYSTDAGCKGERLPHPEPDIFIENSLVDNDEGFHLELGRDFRNIENINVTMDNTEDINNVTSSPEITGLNPDFVNVDHELETPMGQEGPYPAFVEPETEPPPMADGEQDDDEALCPHCSQIPPEELHFVYCNSTTVYKVTVREKGMARVAMNLSPGRTPVRLWKPIRLGLRRRCKCPQLERAGVRVIIMTPKTVFLNSKADGPTDIPLDGSFYIERSENQQGEPDFIKKARTFC